MKLIHVETFFHQPSSTYTHVIVDTQSKHCAIFDPVLDYAANSGTTSTEAADKIVEYVQSQDLTVDWIFETHVHADHLTSAPYLKQKLGGKIAIGAMIQQVQGVFKEVFNDGALTTDGRQFDKLFNDNETFTIGTLNGYVMHTPGHTPACATYVVEDEHVFVGDTIFMPDMGTARCDFPGGDAEVLYQSIQRILSLPDTAKLYMCHDYAPNGREYRYLTTVADEKASNIHVNSSIAPQDFVTMRTERDATLAMPALILPAVQVNMRAGDLPPAEDNGVTYIKIPVNLFS
jgi:glyoxylase-like metal-dependent hydrolase (beta-lactamase superfamily II)